MVFIYLGHWRYFKNIPYFTMAILYSVTYNYGINNIIGRLGWGWLCLMRLANVLAIIIRSNNTFVLFGQLWINIIVMRLNLVHILFSCRWSYSSLVDEKFGWWSLIFIGWITYFQGLLWLNLTLSSNCTQPVKDNVLWVDL